ncbi:YbaK/EbsC family protein [Patescibacteria group bacterium]|nr:YbaK/EbsC family protein [Patescibacteria group bacterium]
MEKLGKLEIISLIERPDLAAKTVTDLAASVGGVQDIGGAEIDPTVSDTTAFCERYGIDPAQTVNCVIVKAKRADKEWYAACAVLATTKADVNGLVRRRLDARRVSFAPMEEAVKETGMEYGGITPVGLPREWPVLIDSAVAKADRLVIGSGIRKSKLVVSGKFLATLPGAVVLNGLGVPRE